MSALAGFGGGAGSSGALGIGNGASGAGTASMPSGIGKAGQYKFAAPSPAAMGALAGKAPGALGTFWSALRGGKGFLNAIDQGVRQGAQVAPQSGFWNALNKPLGGVGGNARRAVRFGGVQKAHREFTGGGGGMDFVPGASTMPGATGAMNLRSLAPGARRQMLGRAAARGDVAASSPAHLKPNTWAGALGETYADVAGAASRGRTGASQVLAALGNILNPANIGRGYQQAGLRGAAIRSAAPVSAGLGTYGVLSDSKPAGVDRWPQSEGAPFNGKPETWQGSPQGPLPQNWNFLDRLRWATRRDTSKDNTGGYGLITGE
jgi:hypothetical protein